MNDTETSGASHAAPDQKTKREKSPLVKVLPTDRIAFDRQVEILKAYAACFESNGGKPVSNEDAGNTLTPKFSAATLNVAVPFFTDIGLLTRNEGKFIPSDALLAYNHAVAFSESEAKRKIRPLFENTWFYRLLAPRLRLANQSVGDCVGVLAVDAKAEQEHVERIAHLLKFLEFAGIVAVSGTTVSFIPLGGPPPTENKPRANGGQEETDSTDKNTETNSVYLDREKKKRVTLKSPLSLSRVEYQRLIKWIEATLIVEDDKENNL
jgi:hypothetical protein